MSFFVREQVVSKKNKKVILLIINAYVYLTHFITVYECEEENWKKIGR
jgi:hypothetical protein